MPTPKDKQNDTLKGHMSPGNFNGAKLAALIKHAIRQVADDEQDYAIEDAFKRARADTLPLAVGELTGFVFGPLFDSVLHRHGVSAAERMIRILTPVLKRKSELELGELPPQSKPQPTVLIVNDDIIVRAQLQSILNSAGYNAISAPDGNIALAMSVRARPDLIISEPRMGHVAGNQLSTMLRVAFRSDAPPLIILSNDDGWGERVAGVCVLKKPVNRELLLAAVVPLLKGEL